MEIIDLTDDSGNLISDVAQIVTDGSEGISWPDYPSALAEVAESFKEQRVSRVAIVDDALALGWIGGIQQYNGHVWELHPLVVKPSEQRRGIGAALVADFKHVFSLEEGKR